MWWGIETKRTDAEEVVKKILETGELVNLNKEHAEYRLAGDGNGKEPAFLVQQMEDMKSEGKTQFFQKKYPELEIQKIHRGVLWTVEGADEAKAKEVADKFLLHNPHSMTIAKFV
jgi:hypothetical protein